MPTITLPTREKSLALLGKETLLSIIHEFNASGHAISTTGNKPLLVRRILRAENPTTEITPPELSPSTLTEIDTQTALAAAVVITNEVTKSHAASVLRSLSLLAADIHELCDENLENWNAQIALARKGKKGAVVQEKKLLGGIPAAIDAIKSSIATYELAKDAAAQLDRDEIKSFAANLVREAQKDRIIDLVIEGDLAGAEELESSIDNAVDDTLDAIPSPGPVKTPGVSTKIEYQYQVLDVSKLDSKFTRTIPNTTEIAKVVKQMGMGAEAVLGTGSVTVWKDAKVRKTGR